MLHKLSWAPLVVSLAVFGLGADPAFAQHGGHGGGHGGGHVSGHVGGGRSFGHINVGHVGGTRSFGHINAGHVGGARSFGHINAGRIGVARSNAWRGNTWNGNWGRGYYRPYRYGYGYGWPYGYGYGYPYYGYSSYGHPYYDYSSYGYPYDYSSYGYPYYDNSSYGYPNYGYPYPSYDDSGVSYDNPQTLYFDTSTPNQYVANSSAQPPAQPPSAQAARVRVIVPDPQARVYFDGVLTTQTGTERSFHTPTLTFGQNYQYNVRAAWTQNGQDVVRNKTVSIVPGGTTVVDFVH
jgi:uncharacterized protein (TIGR03000 family)